MSDRGRERATVEVVDASAVAFSFAAGVASALMFLSFCVWLVLG